MSPSSAHARTRAVASPSHAIAVIDRHAFASNVSSFDTAWRTFGWTPGIAGDRAGRLEESVPWATVAARAERPAQLTGRSRDVLDPANFDSLAFAFVPLDGRLGFSVWGALGRAPGSGEWRVLTHSLLLDRPTFDLISGYPFGLLRGVADVWFRDMIEHSRFQAPAPLDPVVIPVTNRTRQSFERGRLDEVQRLRRRLLAAYAGDADGLARRLAALYEALAATMSGDTVRRVALRGGSGQEVSLLVRLAWLTLPLEDRAVSFFTTEQRKMENPPARLVVLPPSEWGQFVPGATRLLDPFSPAAPRDMSPGRQHWACAVAHDPQRYALLARHAAQRRTRLVARDDACHAAALHAWRQRAPGRAPLDAARELIAIQAVRVAPQVGAPPATAGAAHSGWRAAGHVFGHAMLRHSGEIAGAPASGPLRDVPAPVRCVVVRAAARAIGRACDVDERVHGLRRLLACVDGEWLIEDAVFGPLMDSVERLATAVGEVPAMRDLGGELQRQLLVVLRGRPLSVVQVLALLRLAWIEVLHGGAPITLERHWHEYPRAAIPVLVQLLVSTPPLPVFLRIRRLLLRAPASHFVDRPELERWRSGLAQFCPALHRRMPREHGALASVSQV